jgi:hypothetical protein
VAAAGDALVALITSSRVGTVTMGRAPPTPTVQWQWSRESTLPAAAPAGFSPRQLGHSHAAIHPALLLDFSPLYELQHDQGQTQQHQTGHMSSSISSQRARITPTAKLVAMACHTLLTADWSLLPQVMNAYEGMVLRCCSPGLVVLRSWRRGDGGGAPRVVESWGDQGVAHTAAAAAAGEVLCSTLQYLHDILLRSDDYVRKRPLAEWYAELLRRLPERGGLAAAVDAKEAAVGSTVGTSQPPGRQGTRSRGSARAPPPLGPALLVSFL